MAKKKNQGTFWSRLQEALRDKTGRRFTQTEAGRRYGVTQATVSGEWESRRGPKLERGIEIALDLGVCVEWLYTGRDPKHPGGPAGDVYAAELAKLWSGLSDEDKRDLLGAVRLKAGSRQNPDIAPFTRESSRHGTS